MLLYSLTEWLMPVFCQIFQPPFKKEMTVYATYQIMPQVYIFGVV